MELMKVLGGMRERVHVALLVLLCLGLRSMDFSARAILVLFEQLVA